MEPTELRETLLDGVTPLDTFAKAVDKHPKTLRRLGVPVVKIGRDVYVPIEQGRAWLLNGCKPVEPNRRGVGRRRVA